MYEGLQYKLEDITYPWRIRCRSNLGHIFEEKSVLYTRKYGHYNGMGLKDYFCKGHQTFIIIVNMESEGYWKE